MHPLDQDSPQETKALKIGKWVSLIFLIFTGVILIMS